ncbi:MAG: VanW family protein [Clostridia bacterium]|nr:VanW family protein [Clostridia bacterium]
MLGINKNFCEINPVCYAISEKKEICKRHIKNFLGNEKFTKTRNKEKLENVITSRSCTLIKKGKGIDPVLQENKAVNIKLACDKINGTIIHPGEVFSFWKTVGKTTKKKGYKAGRVITGNKIEPGIGGGLCNLGNTIHWLVLHSPLDVVEFHNHSDALAPDEGKRVPFSSGTSICYNSLDYRFKNNTDQDIQLLVWCEDGKLHGELRSIKEFPWTYKLVEEDHRFEKEGEKFYRISKIYREISDRTTGDVLEKQLVLDNHSEVMYDYSLIPKEQIRL